jgi:hypothetical protein
VNRRIERLFALLGYKLVIRKAVILPPKPIVSLETPTDAIYHIGPVVFEVPIAKCCNHTLFSYAPDGWNPFIESLRDYACKRHITYEGSVLNRYYEKFQPKTHFERYLVGADKDRDLPQCRLRRLLVGVHQLRLPWQPASPGGQGTQHRPPGGVPGYGPVSDVRGRREFSRLTSVYESIKRRGYKPGGERDGEIMGYFLRRPGDYRFVLRDGLHRMAALSVLGYEQARVTFRPDHPHTIDLTDLDNWPQVRSGLLEPQVAEMIFLEFFRDRGVGLAKRLGLLSA